jgi:glucose-6-phosphate 1-epimerase
MMDGQGGLPMVRVETAFSTAEIYLQGAHVTHFQKAGEAPLLFLSSESKFMEGMAIRGGVPVIFPWFGAKEGAPSHGFARTRTWELVEAAADGESQVSLRFRLPNSADPAEAGWAVEYIVMIGVALTLELVVTNASLRDEFSFEDCLHTYFNIGDINAVWIGGLKGVKYRDKVEGFKEKTETSDAIRIAGEVDGVYLDTTDMVEIRDEKLRRKILVRKNGSASTVLWNPWIEKAKQLSDFGDEEYQRMVCVESGNVGKNWVTLKPGESSSLKVTLTSAAL